MHMIRRWIRDNVVTNGGSGSNQWFENLVLVVIILNACTLAIDVPGNKDKEKVQQFLAATEIVFLILFTAEAALKMLALGLIRGTDAYFRTSWNSIDFVIVVLGFLSFIPSFGNFSVIRLLRIIRPLRTVSRVKGMRVLLDSLIKSLSMMFNVALLLLFFLFIFAILGVQLWEGKLHQRCYYRNSTQEEWSLILNDTDLCSTNARIGRACVAEKNGFSGEQQCMVNTTQFKAQVLHFDSIGNALLLVFKLISTDDWPDDMARAQNAAGHHTWLYFVVLTVMGSFFAVNLILAILSEHFSKESAPEEEEEDDEEEECPTPTIERARSQPLAGANGGWKHRVAAFTERPYFNYAMLILTYANVLVLSMDHYRAPAALVSFMDTFNIVAALVFLFEFAIKLWALGLPTYLSDGFNILDAVLVAVSIPEFFFSKSASITAFRAFRLGRVFRFARNKQNKITALLKTIFKSLQSVLYLALIMLLFIFIFSVMGLQLFSDAFDDDTRTNFRSLWESALTVFVVFTGESWASIMQQAMVSTHWTACFYFLAIFVFGNYILINLFIAILIENSSVTTEVSRCEKNNQQTNNNTASTGAMQADAAVRQLAGVPAVPAISPPAHVAVQVDLEDNTHGGHHGPDGPPFREMSVGPPTPTTPTATAPPSVPTSPRRETQSSPAPENGGVELILSEGILALGAAAGVGNAVRLRSRTLGPPPSPAVGAGNIPFPTAPPVSPEWAVNLHFSKEKKRPTPTSTLQTLRAAASWRAQLRIVLVHKYFDWTIVGLILLNGVFLALDRACLEEEDPVLASILQGADYVFTSMFAVEAALKMVAWGLWTKAGDGYLQNRLNLIDTFVVLMSVLGLFSKTFKVFRALRTLRLTIRAAGMQKVVEALSGAIPEISHVVVVSAFIWLVFGILGVQIFKGKFFSCTDPDILLEIDCHGTYTVTDINAFGYPTESEGVRAWVPPPYGFDNIFEAILTLFQVAVGEGWAEMMYAGIDVTEEGRAPVVNSKPANSLYFIAFMVVGGFFMLNLFVGLLIANFADIKDRRDMADLPEAARKWVEASRMVLQFKLQSQVPVPHGRARVLCYRLVRHTLFEQFITVCILVNVIFMALQYWQQPDTFSRVLETANIVFVGIFSVEVVLKLLSFGFIHYFRDHWHKFDCAVVTVSWVGLFLGGPGTSIIRVFRIGRVFRLVKHAQELQKLFSTLLFALPSLVNIAVLLLITFFIFGVMGVQLFGKVRHNDTITDNNNFESLGYAVLLLYSISTTETWPNVLTACKRKEPPDCEPELSNCGTNAAYPYFIIFMIVGSFILLNLLITVVMENFGKAEFYEAEKLAQFDVYLRNNWESRDQQGTGKMLSRDFIAMWLQLGSPLGLGPPITPDQLKESGGFAVPGKQTEFESLPDARLHQIRGRLEALAIPIDKEFRVKWTDVLNGLLRTVYNVDVEVARELHRKKAKLPKVPSHETFCLIHYYALKKIEWYLKHKKAGTRPLPIVRLNRAEVPSVNAGSHPKPHSRVGSHIRGGITAETNNKDNSRDGVEDVPTVQQLHRKIDFLCKKIDLLFEEESPGTPAQTPLPGSPRHHQQHQGQQPQPPSQSQSQSHQHDHQPVRQPATGSTGSPVHPTPTSVQEGPPRRPYIPPLNLRRATDGMHV